MKNIENIKARGIKILRKYKFDKQFLGKQKLTEQSFFTVNQGALACFSELCQSLSCNNRIIEVNLSGCSINVYYAIELANLVQKNTNIQVVQLASCKLNSFSLSCIFKAMIDHTGLAHLNLFNNQSFTPTVVQDFIKYVLKGKNPLNEINISHCNIENAQLSIILPALRHLKSLKYLQCLIVDASKCLQSLSSAMLHYTGQNFLEYLDISYCWIKNHGIELLSRSLYLSVSLINLKSVNLSGNHISQDGVIYLEQLLLKLNLEELTISRNKISEFQNQQVLSMMLMKVDFSNNLFEEVPNNFFLNVISINLSGNLINTQGAYQISQVLTNKKVCWAELNINDNQIKTRGFISLVYALIENKSLTSLSVANNKINGEGILVYIFNHEQLNLTYLDLSVNYLRYDLVYALISMMKECKLKSLILSSLLQDENEIQSGKNEFFEIKCANLRQLDFSSNPQIILPILQSLSKQYNRIEYLNLNGCQLIKQVDNHLKKSDTLEVRKSGDAKCFGLDELIMIDFEAKHTLNKQQQNNNELILECIQSLLQKTYTLQVLSLANNNLHFLNEMELKTLENAFANNFTLVSLDLSSNKLKSKIVFLVNGIKNCGSLRYLNISNNQIDEDYEVMIKLPEMLKNPSLEYVDISKNSIHGATFFNMKKVLAKQYKQFPELNLNQLQLTADDLISISQMIRESYSIRKLDLYGNPSIDYSNNILSIGNKTKMKSLSINRLQLRNDIFENLLSAITSNYKSLQIVEVSNTLFRNKQLGGFLESLKKIHTLKALLLDNQYFDCKSVIEALRELSILKLKILSIRKSILSYEFFEFLRLLLNQTEKLIELDLSNNQSNSYKQKCVFPIQSFQSLCDGIQVNKSLISLNISSCSLDDDRLEILLRSLTLNTTLTQLDISENNITQRTFIKFMKYFHDFPSSLQILKCLEIKAEYPSSFTKAQCFRNLFNLDISKNSQRNRSLRQIIKCCMPQNIFQNLTYINLEQCSLSDYHCQELSQLMKTNLRELHLGQNFITYHGFQKLFNPILENLSNLRALNVSKNKINDDYFCDLEQRQLIRTTSLRLLAIDGNLLFGRGCKGVIKLLQSNPQLYIFNYWNNICDELAYLVVESYIRFTQDYNIRDVLPNYFRELWITDTNISDEFLIWFGLNYYKLPYLQVINFSGNTRLCTSMGKMHMYINMINNQTNFNLLEVKFDEVEQQTLTIFDDGLIRYHLMKQKLKFQNYKLLQSSYGINEQTIEKVKWGFLGKFIIHIINKLLFLFQGPLTEFRISSQLQKCLRRKFNRVKMYYILGCLVDPFTFIIAFATAIMARTSLSLDMLNDNNCKFQDCFVNDAGTLMQTLFFINILIIVSICLVCLHIAIILRNHSQPDYCILTSEQKKSLLLKFPTRREIFLLILQMILYCKYIFDVLLISCSYDYADFIQKYCGSELISEKYQFLVVADLMIILSLIKLLLSCFQDIKCSIEFFKHENGDPSFLLTNLWQKNIYEQSIIVESVTSTYCPQYGIRMLGKLYNLKQIYELTQLFVLEIPVFIIYILFFTTYSQLFSQLGYFTVFTVTGIILFIGMIRNIIKILYNAYWVLVSRPPVVKWFDINEVLLLRRYEQFGVKEFNTRIINKNPSKQKKDQIQKPLIKKKQIASGSSEQQSKSERIIQKKKTSRKPSSEQNESVDLINDKQPINQAPIFGVQNTKMKIE